MRSELQKEREAGCRVSIAAYQTVTKAAGFWSQQSWWQLLVLLSSFLVQQLPVRDKDSSYLIAAALQCLGDSSPPPWARVNSVGCHTKPHSYIPSCAIPTWCSFHGSILTTRWRIMQILFWFRIWEDLMMFDGEGNPLQYSCLGNPMDGGAW